MNGIVSGTIVKEIASRVLVMRCAVVLPDLAVPLENMLISSLCFRNFNDNDLSRREFSPTELASFQM